MGKVYYTLLGGGVEPTEKPEEAAIREVKEESTIIITNPRLVFVEETGDIFGSQYIYLCDYVSGEPNLPAESEEAFWSKDGINTYQPIWFPYEKLSEIPFLPKLLKEVLTRARTEGFPDKPFHFSSKHAERLN